MFQNIDIERTIGINIHYVDTLDFKLAHDDKQFLIEVSGCVEGRKLVLGKFGNSNFGYKNII